MTNQDNLKLQIIVSEQVERMLGLIAEKRGQSLSAVGREILTIWARQEAPNELAEWLAMERQLAEARALEALPDDTNPASNQED